MANYKELRNVELTQETSPIFVSLLKESKKLNQFWKQKKEINLLNKEEFKKTKIPTNVFFIYI